MTEYETDEQRVEALKKWWDENGTSLIIGAVLGIGILLGWRGWVTWQENRAMAASTLYEQAVAAAEAGDVAETRVSVGKLISDYASTPYAALGAMELARMNAGAEDLKGAEEHLRWALEFSPQQRVQEVARLRLARVLVARERPDDALDLLSRELPQAYVSLYEEIRGDAWRAKGEPDKAREAYTRALATAPSGTEYLNMKRDELGPSAQ